MISFDEVCFNYGGEAVLKNISFQIAKGEFVALLGENGAGKTTLSKMFNGLLKPSSGTIAINGLDVKTTKTSRYAQFLGFLFQNPDTQICQNTALDEVMFGMLRTGKSAAEAKARALEILAAFSLDSARAPLAMSRGERQRLALISLVAGRPEILVLDEPTTGLDWRECLQIMDMLAELNGGGVTIIMVCHDMEIVRDYARRVLILNDGELIADGDVQDIMLQEDTLARASLLPPQITALGLRLGGEFAGLSTAKEMAGAIKKQKEQAIKS